MRIRKVMDFMKADVHIDVTHVINSLRIFLFSIIDLMTVATLARVSGL